MINTNWSNENVTAAYIGTFCREGAGRAAAIAIYEFGCGEYDLDLDNGRDDPPSVVMPPNTVVSLN
jgi:hypothetical protein